MSEYKIKEEEITDIRKLLEPGLKKVLEDHEKWVESSRRADPSFRTFWEMNGIYDNSKEGRKRDTTANSCLHNSFSPHLSHSDNLFWL